MERLDLILTHAAALFIGASLFTVLLRRKFRADLRMHGPGVVPIFKNALYHRQVETPMALLAVPAFEEAICRFPLLLWLDRATHPNAWIGIAFSAALFATSRFVFGKPPLEAMPPDADDAKRKRLHDEKQRDFVQRIQAFVLGGLAGVALAALALQTQNLLLVYAVHVIAKFTLHRALGIARHM